MKFTSISLFSSLLTLALSAPSLNTRQSPNYAPFSSRTIFQSPANYTVPGVLYARTALLPSGNLLATWENYSPEPPAVYFPIYESCDGGQSWTEISRITDQTYGYGLRYQPFLYVLPQDLGGLPAGTVLLAGSSIPTDLSSTHIELYYSPDNGHTWSFLSHISEGGRAVPDNGETPVWEPFLLAYNDQLVCFYSDQRDRAHGQKLVHQVSSDLLTWGDVVDDVSYPTYTDRPGMTTVIQLPNQQWMMTYEYGGGPLANNPNSTNYVFPVYYRISDSPLTFDSAPGQPLIPSSGAGSTTQPTGSPYIVWTDAVGGDNGAIVVSSGCCSEVYVNTQLGAQDAWTSVPTPERASYTRHLRVLEKEPNLLLIVGGGLLPPSQGNRVSDSVVDLVGLV
ncbi:MAG: hypothetical protein Q9160_000500 [Pyrenula sp. 1 TL-2023]